MRRGGRPGHEGFVAAEAAGARRAGMSGMIRSVAEPGSAGLRGVSSPANGSSACDRHRRGRFPDAPHDNKRTLPAPVYRMAGDSAIVSRTPPRSSSTMVRPEGDEEGAMSLNGSKARSSRFTPGRGLIPPCLVGRKKAARTLRTTPDRYAVATRNRRACAGQPGRWILLTSPRCGSYPITASTNTSASVAATTPNASRLGCP